MLNTKEAWRLIAENAPRGEWLKVRDLYALVETRSDLDSSDLAPIGKGSSARWHRTVRNALQAGQKNGLVSYERGQGYMLPTEASGQSTAGT